ncbi:MAG TPA: succinyl-diaminopimelate desuccinylase [Candidatus Pelagibacter bacterium]|jgi:succinyl-diaminopimelate desuccinylase|nr:succinyl-diaminopimelate desuccinylase [Candidatus Pelagibacter bacterium]
MKNFDEIKLAKELIRFPTIMTEDRGIMKFLSKKLSSMGFKCKIIKSKGLNSKPALNLFAKFGNSRPHISFLGHTDVVLNLENWSFSPFKSVIKKGYLYGRGAQDMKGGIACWISAVRKFIKSDNFKGSISIIIAADEETTGYGTPTVINYLRKRKEKIDFIIVGEPSSNKKIGDEIRIGRRGSMNAILTVIGKSGHTAFHGSYINPCTTLARIIAKLKNTRLDSGTKYMPPSHLEISKMNVDNLSENVVPQSAEAYFNVRFNLKHKSSSLKKKLNRIISTVVKKDKCKFKIDYRVSGEAFYTKPNKEIYMVKKVIKKITNTSAKLNCRGGTSDSRFLGSIPRLELGLRNNTIHMVDERTSVSDMKKLSKIYYSILDNYFA